MPGLPSGAPALDMVPGSQVPATRVKAVAARTVQTPNSSRTSSLHSEPRHVQFVAL